MLRWAREPGSETVGRNPAASDSVRLPIDPSVLLAVGAGMAMLGYLLAVWGLSLVAGFPWALRLAHRAGSGPQDEYIARVGAQTTGLALLGLGLALLAMGVCSGGTLYLLLERLSQ